MALDQDVHRDSEDAARKRALQLLQQFGWNATSFQVLEPGFRYFFDGDDACVAYVRTRHAWVAGGAPIAPLERQAEVAERFVRAARAQGLRAVFAFTEPRFLGQAEFAALQMGEQPVWNPQTWKDTLARSRSLREQLRRARAKGVRVRRLAPEELSREDSPMRQAIMQLVARWQSSRSMAPMGFLVAIHLFEFIEQRHFLVAEGPNGLVGLLGMVPVYARGGVLVEDLLRSPDAPNGTTELLIDQALREAAAEGCEYFTLGLAPLSGEVAPWLRAARQLGRGLYDFSGLRRFKAKFMPREWTPIYLSYPRGQTVYLSIFDLLEAFAQGGLLRFGIKTVLRGPALVVRTLTLLLVPWTFVLASLDSLRYFPAAWVKWAWVVFDIGLLFALTHLTLRFDAHWARGLALVIGCDAVLTLLEALMFNLPRARTLPEVIGIVVAVAAPALAAVVLRNVWRRSLA